MLTHYFQKHIGSNELSRRVKCKPCVTERGIIQAGTQSQANWVSENFNGKSDFLL